MIGRATSSLNIWPDTMIGAKRLSGEFAGLVDRAYQFLDDGQLLADPASTPYLRYWNAARADSVRRAA